MRKIALMTGIANYPTAPLIGPVDDVIDFANVLFNDRGFARTEVIPVTNQRATTKNIKTYLEQIVDLLQPGDFGLWYYTGHGAQVPTLTPELEPAGLDQVICPYDFDWSPDRMITDKWLHNLFCRLRKGVQFVWISDSCHSGDLTREILLSRGLSKAFPVDHDVLWAQQAAAEVGLVAKKDLSSDPLDLAFISACQSYQTASDACFGGRYNGAFTYYLLQVMHSVSPVTPVVDIVARVTELLIQNGYPQRPTVEGLQIQQPLLCRNSTPVA